MTTDNDLDLLIYTNVEGWAFCCLPDYTLSVRATSEEAALSLWKAFHGDRFNVKPSN